MEYFLSGTMFYRLLLVMTMLAVGVFFTLYHVDAGYGILISKRWGRTVPNRWAWMFMEAPVFIAMTLFWFFSDRRFELVLVVFFLLFQMHYLQRAFIFPWLIRGRSRMPLSIMYMGVTFNLANSYMQGVWLFYLSPDSMYEADWLLSPQFIIGTILFLAGFIVNLHSDYVIRHLRKDGDNSHYLPQKGLFGYVVSANYFGEIVEWLGFAVLTWSLSGLVFFIWTFANLVPRANATYIRYQEQFSEEMAANPRKRVFPFLY
jgi:3-oxo-5-alpha-steroid 4-dehydrogenase 1